MRTRLISTLIASLFAAVAVALPATAAHANIWAESAPAQVEDSDSPITAAWDHTLYTTDDNPGGRLRFERDGDKVEVCDRQADGWRAVGYVWDTVTKERVHTIYVPGNGTCKTRDDTDHNMIEGRLYTFRICLDHDDSSRDDDRFCNFESYRA